MSSTDVAPPSPMANAPVASDADSRGSTRRRQVVVSAVVPEQKSSPLAETASPAANERPQINGRDLSHAVRRESVLLGSRDHLMRGVIDSRGRPRRSAPKHEKPKWVTVVNVLTKNAILLMVLFWVGQAMWRWSYGFGPSSDVPFVALDLENRVSEVEALLKTTSKMTQVQLDVMERKRKQTEERVANLEKDVSNLVSRADSLDSFLVELRDANFLSKKEFDMFAEDFRNNMAAVKAGSGFGLEDISRYAREVIIKELEKHAADGIGRVDYALISGGATILKHSEAHSVTKTGSWLKRGRRDVHADAQKMLEPSFGEPGRCFALKGNHGFVEIKLKSPVIPDAVTLEHVAKSVAYDRSSAPKDCRVWGWFEGEKDDPITEYGKMSLLTEFSYDLSASNVQTFEFDMTLSTAINTVRLEFISNHGNPNYTCIYRFRVHGHELVALV